jgi:hypothetical protein
MTMVIGFTERGADGQLHSAAAVMSNSTISGIYRETCPVNSAWGSELVVLCTGDRPCVVSVEPAWEADDRESCR